MALMHLNFESEYLMNNHEISVILPDKPRGVTPAEFYGGSKKYKVLWLLHGTFGDHSDWIRKSNIELYACEKDLIVVMPSAMNSDYTNWPGFGTGYNMYDYFFEELMPFIYGWLPASDKREDNFIAGLSMGGMGTIKYAVNHPEKFAAAAVLSYAPMDLNGELLLDMGQRWQNMLANAGGMEAYKASNDHLWRMVDELSGKNVLPKLYFACGREDFLYKMYMHFKAHAQEIGLDATFEEFDGYQHEWRFWDMTIQRALTFFGLEEDGQGNPF